MTASTPPNLNPTAIAREALGLLAKRRTAPTPDNYRRIYNEIAGLPHGGPGPDAGTADLAGLARRLPDDLPERAAIAASIEAAAASQSWPEAADALRATLQALDRPVDEAGGSKPDAGDRGKAWAQLIDDLIKEWETRRPGWTAARKRESLDRALGGSTRTGELLLGRLRGLISNWQQPVPGGKVAVELADQAELVGQQTSEILSELRAALVHALESIAPAHLADAPELAETARHLAIRVRGARDRDNAVVLRGELRELLRKVAAHTTVQSDLRSGLLRLLRLLVDNIQEFAFGDTWLQQQVAVVRQGLDKPLTAGALAETEKAVRDLMLKQGVLKQSLDEARETLKTLVKTLVDQLGALSQSTGDFCVRLDNYSERISTASQVSELNQVLAELIDDTRSIQATADRTRHELDVARNRVGLAELRIQQMEQELEALNGLAKEDALTGALNRHGLDEAFQREAGRSDRAASRLCMALLDVDNFKQFNDRFGHQAGDAALQHLVEVVRDCLRGHDAVARYGGEEFVLLLPETDLPEAVAILTRLQRQLTKRFFMHRHEKLLITFSCGVAERVPAEPMDTLLARADQALYRAKQTGKNRVVTAEAA
jgi:diguanylate cyclase